MGTHNKLGNKGEDIARQHLEEKGYQILAQNYRYRHEEIDLICIKPPFIVIVEVKTRSSSSFGKPESFVSKDKQKHLINAANHYIQTNSIDYEARFDIVSILIQNEKTKIHHLEDAFAV